MIIFSKEDRNLAEKKRQNKERRLEELLGERIEERLDTAAEAAAVIEAEVGRRIESKIEQKKKQKRSALLNSAYKLFSTNGFSDTTIRDITRNAGVAKGTFYLYYEDKEDILRELMRIHAARLLTGACAHMEKVKSAASSNGGEHAGAAAIEQRTSAQGAGTGSMSVEDKTSNHRSNSNSMSIADKFIYIIDYIVDHVVADPALLKLVSKNLSWGLFNPTERGSFIDPDAPGSETGLDFESYIANMLEADGVRLREPRLLIFTLLQMVASTCYDALLYEEPVSLEEYKPYLNNCIRLLVEDAIIK